MNIKEAKQEIENTLRAYLTKDELGNYLIPSLRQRPVLLMGPPGIGKTQIMEQIAGECGVGLVSYTITHHTRQSAMGLPFIQHRSYGGEERAVTEYTMSEILASVYELMEKTGEREGILFLDEINCVSETLAPMMLQFLQCKTFGNQRLPEGWLIVAAGNPPEYNRSVREFDVVTLDRVKRIDVREDYAVWKEYAQRNGLHGAVLSYLDIQKDHFYRVETTVDGVQFVTARGWEDLSEMIYAYEKLGLRVDRGVVGQYLQMPAVAKDFANYLELYYKYQKSYHVEEVLSGKWEKVMASELRAAPFDEKLSVMGLILSRLCESARGVRRQDAFCSGLHEVLQRFKSRIEREEPAAVLKEESEALLREMELQKAAGHLDRETRSLLQREAQALEGYRKALSAGGEAPMDLVRGRFQKEVESREALGESCGAQFENAFRYLEESLGESQELVIFVTELTASFDASWFIEEFGCEAYFRHNRELLFDDTRHRIRREIAAAKAHEEE